MVSDSQIREGKNEGDVENGGDIETGTQMWQRRAWAQSGKRDSRKG